MTNPEVSLKVLLNFLPTGTAEVDAFLQKLKIAIGSIPNVNTLAGKTDLLNIVQNSILSKSGQPLDQNQLQKLALAFENRESVGAKGGMGWRNSFQLNTANDPMQYAQSIQEVDRSTKNATQSFWGMWQVSWAVRGAMTDLFGYANSGMIKIRQASQAIISSLYVYEAVLKKLTDTYQMHFISTLAGKQLQINVTKAQLALDEVLADKNATMIAQEQAKTALLNAEQAKNAGMAAAAAPAIPIAVGIAGTMMAIGLYQQFLAIAQEVNKSRESIHNLAQSLTTLTTAIGGTKLAFTNLDDLIKEVAKDVPSLATELLSIQDPIERFAKATAIIYQQDTAKRLPTSNPFSSLIAYIKEQRLAAKEYNEWAKENGAPLTYGGMSVYPTDPRYYAYLQKQALSRIISGTAITGEETEKEQFINNIFMMRNSLIKDESKDYDKLREEVKKYGIELLVSQFIAQSDINISEDKKQKIKELTQAYHDLTAEQIKNDRGRLASSILQQLQALGVTNPDELLAGLEKGLQNYYDIVNKYEESNVNKTTPMTLLEFDRQMYENYTSAAKNNSIYSQQADFWKNKLIADLRNEISTQEAAVKGMTAYTDKWKETQVIIAKARSELEELLHLQEKLSSTWFNIPTAIVRPTESQLTQATVYLKPNIYVTASGKNEIAEAVAKGLNDLDYVYNYSTIRGGAGG